MIRDMYLLLAAKTLINLVLRAIYALSNKAARRIGKKVRYFKTVSGPEVEIQVVTEPTPDGGHKGIVGRIKAWDADVPLMCGYNRVEVVGDCDL